MKLFPLDSRVVRKLEITFNHIDFYITRMRFFDADQNLIAEVGRLRQDTSMKEFVLDEDERIVGFASRVQKQELTDFH